MTGTAFRGGILLALLFAVSAALATETRVAVVYSAMFDGRCRNDFDANIQKLGWKVDKIENVRISELSDTLDSYDYVLLSSCANYKNTVNLSKYAQKWRAWLEKGGGLLVMDANYGSVLENWVGALGEGFTCSCRHCSSYTRRSPETRALTLDKGDHFLTVPSPLGIRHKEHYVQWCHLTRLGDAWHKPICCVDGNPVLAYRAVGRGLVVLTAAVANNGNVMNEYLLRNMQAYKEAIVHGVFMTGFAADAASVRSPRPGYVLTLKADPVRYKRLDVTLTGNGPACAVSSDVAPDGVVAFRLSSFGARRGTVKQTLTVKDGDKSLFSFSWEENIPATAELKLLHKHLYPGDELVVQATLDVPPVLQRGVEAFEWRIDDGAWQRRDAQTGTWSIPATSADGRHVLQGRVTYKPGFRESAGREERELLDWGDIVSVDFFKHPEPRYRMRADHVLLEDGKPFFPFGWYMVSWSTPAAARAEMMHDIASWGYNSVHVGIRRDEIEGDGYGAFLDDCAAHNVRVLTEFGMEAAPKIISRYRGKPAVMGWNPGDEPAPKGILPGEMFRRYDLFKQLDHDHLAYTVICVPAQYANYAAGTDVLAPDPYPVPNARLDEVYKRFKEAKAAANDVDTALWAVCQAFGGYGGWSRPPDAREFRAMSYLALMAGAKGIIYYTYSDGGFDIRKAPGLFEAAKTFPAEMKDFIPFILDGTCRMLAEDVSGAYAAEWRLGATRRVVVVNSKKESVSLTLPFTGGKVILGALESLERTGDNVTLKLAPLERVVLQ